MKHLSLFLYFCLLSLTAFAQDSDFPPKADRLVNDFADMLSPQEEQALEQKLVNYYDTTSSQVAVVLMSSIGGYDINQYAAELGERWGIGTGKYDNGLVILVAEEERKVAIQTGYGMEGYIPDAIAKRITERTLKPAFAEGHFYEGLDRATTLIFELASGVYQADPTAQGAEGESGGPSLIFIIIIVVLVLILFSKMGGGRGGRGGRRYSRTFGGPVIIPGGFGTFRSGGGMFGGGGGGGGGFGGFGGGSFGGGGASSSW